VFERFTSQARSVAVLAQQEARAAGHEAVGAEHVLLGLLGERTGSAARILEGMGLDLDGVRRDVARLGAAEPVGFGEADADALRSVGIDLDEVRRSVEETFGEGALEVAPAGATRRGHIPFAPHAKKALELALREALHLGHGYIGTEHVLLGLARDGDSPAVSILRAHGVEPDAIRAAVLRELEDGGEHPGRTA
jgi:ATP-dependent Clp protease ATP-binding subunit ClpA